MVIPILKAVWTALTGRYTKDGALQAAGLEQVIAHYSGPGRHYHTLQHLYALLQLHDKYAPLITDPDTLQFAIFFHDLVYDVQQHNNEEKSAAAAEAYLRQLNCPAPMIQQVQQYILSTRNHLNPSGHPDLDYFLDFDLSILGAPEEAYGEYVAQVRAEYAVYSDEVYNAGRQKVLRHFLSLPTVYRTSPFRQLEEKARQNMTRELQALMAP